MMQHIPERHIFPARVSFRGDALKERMRKLFFVFTILVLLLHSFPAVADGCTNLVYYDCQPNRSLIVTAFCLPDVFPVVNEHTILLETLTDMQKRECQITSSEKAFVTIGVSLAHPRNNNLSVFVNKNWLGTSTFDAPDHTYTYIVTNKNNVADVTYIDAVPNETIRTTYLNTDAK